MHEVRLGAGWLHYRAREKGCRRSGKLTALLDAAAGIEYEGEAKPAAGEDDRMAIRAWNLLADEMGGIDYAGLPLVCAHLGVADIDGLLIRLSTIKSHKKPGAPE